MKIYRRYQEIHISPGDAGDEYRKCSGISHINFKLWSIQHGLLLLDVPQFMGMEVSLF